MHATTTITTAFPAVPVGVDLTAERHEELLQTMTAGRAAIATAAEIRAALLASNAILTAYWSLIVRRARGALHGAAADDRAGEAGVRAVIAIRSYDPGRGVPLLAYFAAQRVWDGEAVMAAGLPLGASSRAERREAWRVGDGVVGMLSLDLDPELGEMAFDDGQEAFDLECDLRSAMDLLDDRDREWMARSYGLGGAIPVATEDLASAAGVSAHTVRRSLADSRDSLRELAPWLAFAA